MILTNKLLVNINIGIGSSANKVPTVCRNLLGKCYIISSKNSRRVGASYTAALLFPVFCDQYNHKGQNS